MKSAFFCDPNIQTEGEAEICIYYGCLCESRHDDSTAQLKKKSKLIGFVTDYPIVMQATRTHLCGSKSDGSNCCVFAYGCICHELSNLVTDVSVHDEVKGELARTITQGQLFRSTHIPSDLLTKEKKAMTKVPHSLKAFSTTRGNVVAVLQSVLANRKPICDVFTNQQMEISKERVLIFEPSLRYRPSKMLQLMDCIGPLWKTLHHSFN